MRRFRAWLAQPRKTPTNRAVLIGAIVSAASNVTVRRLQDERHRALEERVDKQEAMTAALLQHLGLKATTERVGETQ